MKHTCNETIQGDNTAQRALRANKSPCDVGAVFQVSPESIAGYIFMRSPSSHSLFNCYAVDSDGELLFCLASDLDFDKASSWVDALNREYYPEVQSPTEVAFVEIGGESKVYNITATK